MPIKRIRQGENDLASLYPEIADQAHGWDPSLVTVGSNKNLEWKCGQGHLYKTSTKQRTILGRGCPYCSGKRVLQGYNDLITTSPAVAAEWHPTLNGVRKPTDFTKGSKVSIWWKCSKHSSHIWSAPIKDRNKCGCPFCSGKRVLAGSNDLASLYPEISSEWHPFKNNGLLPSEVTHGSEKRVWWRCKWQSGHEWQATIKNRTLRGSNCPICSGSRVMTGFNDLSTVSPDIAEQWHKVKNGELHPSQFTTGSSIRVWWQCKANPSHEWVAAIGSRSKSGCPICSGNRIDRGVNDLATTSPEIIRDWHPTLNQPLSPLDFSRGSDQRVWWKCPNYSDHEWQSSIVNKRGCPICAGKQIQAGFNDLQTTSPEIANTWHPRKNGELKPSQISRGSKRRVWWQCSLVSSHEWQTTVNARGITGCPYCAGKRVLPGINDLATIDPRVAAEWHPTKNGALTPADVARYSSKKAWWRCSKHPEHEWISSIAGRRGCPVCSGNQILVGFNDLQTTHPGIASQWHTTKNGSSIPTEFSKGSTRKIWWICPNDSEHEWEASINSRTSLDSGCPSCAQVGYDPNQDGWFYLMQRPGEQQIGITNDLTRRIKQHEKNGWTLIDWRGPSSGRDVQKLESRLKKWLRADIGLVEGTHENWTTVAMEVVSLADLGARSGIAIELT
jgi:Zn ribbon nucleic-acid-binding protein